jgi:nucleoside-diphosphate-sugar epimerase
MAEPPTLVTGAPGWLGTRLVEVLARGLPDVPALATPDPERRIRCLVLRGVSPRALTALSPRVEAVEGDIGDPASLAPFFRGAEGATLLHLCGLIHPRRIRELYAVNVEGGRDVLEAAAAVCAASSASRPTARRAATRARTPLRRERALPPVHALRAVEEADGGPVERGPRQGPHRA